MESISKLPNTTKGTEVLFVPNVEVQKVKGTRTLFASSGDLSVLYFRDYGRYLLRLNDWFYPLMRRIPITSEKGALSQTFTLPASNGFSFRLIFNDASTPAFGNFETLLGSHAGYTIEKQGLKAEHSPDDKLMRKPITKKDMTTGLTSNTATSKVTGLIKSGYEKIKHVAMGPGKTKNLTSTKHAMKLSDIKTKNFKKDAKSSFKKSFFDDEKKMTSKFFELRNGNSYNTQASEFKKITDSTGPSFFFSKDSIEESILKGKDLIHERKWEAPETEKKGIVDSLKSGLTGLKDTLTGHTSQARPAQKDTQMTEGRQNVIEHGMTHYEG